MERRQAEAEQAQSSDDIIPEVLCRSNDIFASDNSYEISIMARVWFREHSNIDEVLNDYFIVNKIENPNKNVYLGCIIRGCLNRVLKTKYPFCTFRFHTMDDEIMGKFLILHPDIKMQPDMEVVETFFKTKQIKLCCIDMSLRNDLHKDVQTSMMKIIDQYGPKNC
jgi:hypothetical protein